MASVPPGSDPSSGCGGGSRLPPTQRLLFAFTRVQLAFFTSSRRSVVTCNDSGRAGCTSEKCGFWPVPSYFVLSYGYRSRKVGYGRFCSSRCPAPCPPTRGGVSRRQAHAARLPLRTYDQVRQTRLRLCERSPGASRSLPQPHACHWRQDALPLPHRRTGRPGPATDRYRPRVSRPGGCLVGGMRNMGRPAIGRFGRLLGGC